MAVSVIGAVMYQSNANGLNAVGQAMQMPELSLANLKDFSASNGGVSWWPFMFTTISCGAISGFHATQSPMVAKCVKDEREGKKVFYGAMVLEGVIALIWAAVAMSYYGVTVNVDGANGWKQLSDALKAGSGPASVVQTVCESLLGKFGIILAVAGVVICPITSGDTALRSTRLIIAEWFNIDQGKIQNRIFVTLPLFGIAAGLSIFGIFDYDGFNILWQWFVWCNQVFAAFALWIASAFLIKYGRYRFGSLLTAIPATFMTGVVVCFLFADTKMSFGQLYNFNNLPMIIGSAIAGAAMAAALAVYIYKLVTASPPREQLLVKFPKSKIVPLKRAKSRSK